MKLVVIIVILLLFTLAVVLFQGDMPSYTRHETASRMENIHLTHTQNGVTEWSATISSATFVPESNETLLSDVHFFFSSQGIRINADRGTYDTLRNNISLAGNVEASSDDIIVMVDSMSWSSASNELESDSPVLIEGGTFTVKGKGLHINRDGDIRIKEDTRALITF